MGKSSSRSDAVVRSERKFQKKLDFYARVRDTVASLAAQKNITKKKKLRSRQKKLKAYNLSSLSEYLLELETSQPSAPAADLKVNCKSRQKLVIKEGIQSRTVLNHPVFKSDPLAAIHQHLQSTQPVLEEKPRKKKPGKKVAKKKKKKSPAASSVPQSMET